MASCCAKSSVPWIFRLFMGGTPDEVAERYQIASPISHVSADDPPVLTIHGDQHGLVPLEQARKLNERIKAVGATHTLMVVEGQGHGFDAEYQKRAAEATWEFFDKYLKQ